jgi:hypothetical protein
VGQVFRKRFGLLGWQRAALFVLGMLNLSSCGLFYREHRVWSVRYAVMALLLFTFLVLTWPTKGKEG